MPLSTGNTAITTAGNGTLTAAALLGGVITRSGPSGGFTDTTDTAANLAAALGMGNTPGPVTRLVQYINASAQTATLAGGTGVTVTANTGAGLTVATGVSADLLVSINPAAGTATVLVLARTATQ